MPVGPSHSRHNSSRSSSRSYSSSSRSSYSSGRSRSYSSSSYRPSHRSYTSYNYYGGSYGYGGGGVSVSVSPKAWAVLGLIFGFIFASIFAFIGGFLFFSNVGSALLMRKDAKEYYEIIERAKEGEEGYYLITIDNIRSSGSSTHGWYPSEYSFSGSHDCRIEGYSEVSKDGINYYYLVYTFYDDYGNRITGETYSCYSESALYGLSSITFAYTQEYDGDGSWDVMPTNYQLKNNMDYWSVKRAVLLGVVFLAVGSGLIVLFVFLSKKLANKNKNKEEVKQEPPKKKKADYKICDYCGAHHSLSDKVCSSCGSRKFTTPTID